MIITRTPLRVSFLGGGTDYPKYFTEHGGEVLATSINRYSYVTVSSRTVFFDKSIRVSYSKTEITNSVDDIQHPVVRACLKMCDIGSNIEIHHISDLPARTGLGSSSSFVVCLLHALWTFKGRAVSQRELAFQAIEIEQDILKESVGSQDQYMAAFGNFRHVRFKDKRDIQSSPVIVSPDRLRELEGSLLMFYTDVQRSASEVASEQDQRTQSNLAYLNEMKSLVGQGLEVLQSDCSLNEFGKLLHIGWNLKKALSSKITTPMVDDIYSKALEAGAIGGKLLGAGAGGFVLFFVEKPKQESVRRALAPLKEVRFGFDNSGSQIVHYQTS